MNAAAKTVQGGRSVGEHNELLVLLGPPAGFRLNRAVKVCHDSLDDYLLSLDVRTIKGSAPALSIKFTERAPPLPYAQNENPPPPAKVV